jgi:hypothetical protein
VNESGKDLESIVLANAHRYFVDYNWRTLFMRGTIRSLAETNSLGESDIAHPGSAAAILAALIVRDLKGNDNETP